MATDVRIFGAVLLDQREQMIALAGRAAYARAVASLPEDPRAEYEGLGFFGWCRHQTATAVTVALARELGWPPERLQEEIVCRGVERTFGTIWRSLLRIPSDEALVRRAAFIYSKTIRGSRLEARVNDGRVRLVLHGWPDCPPLDQIALRTGIETVLHVAGRPEARVVAAPAAEGPALTFDVLGARLDG